jgi:hypothetical protein
MTQDIDNSAVKTKVDIPLIEPTFIDSNDGLTTAERDSKGKFVKGNTLARLNTAGGRKPSIKTQIKTQLEDKSVNIPQYYNELHKIATMDLGDKPEASLARVKTDTLQYLINRVEGTPTSRQDIRMANVIATPDDLALFLDEYNRVNPQLPATTTAQDTNISPTPIEDSNDINNE